MGELLEGLIGGAGWGLAAGVAVGAVAGTVIRPAVAGLVRTGMEAADHLGRWAGPAREQLDTLVAEARAEHAAAHTGAATSAPASTSAP